MKTLWFEHELPPCSKEEATSTITRELTTFWGLDSLPEGVVIRLTAESYEKSLDGTLEGIIWGVTLTKED